MLHLATSPEPCLLTLCPQASSTRLANLTPGLQINLRAKCRLQELHSRKTFCSYAAVIYEQTDMVYSLRIHCFGGCRLGGKALLPTLPPEWRKPQVVGRDQRPRLGMRVQANSAFWERILNEHLQEQRALKVSFVVLIWVVDGR